MKNLLILKGAEAKKALAFINVARGQKPLTLAEAAHGWNLWRQRQGSKITAIQYADYLNTWLKDVGHLPISKADEESISKWVNAEGAKRSSRRVKLSIVRSFFKYLDAKNLLSGPDPSRLVCIDHSTLTHFEKETREVSIFYDHEFRKLLNYIESEILRVTEKSQAQTGQAAIRKLGERINRLEFWRKALVIGRCAGLRFGDVCQLEWDCFGEVFTVWTDKRNKRVQPAIWNQELWNRTFQHLAHVGANCFPKERLEYLNENKRKHLPMEFSRLCKYAGLSPHTFHGLRHTYATDCHEKGIPTPHIAAALGHSRTEVTQKYIH